jgi:hypothetical protein
VDRERATADEGVLCSTCFPVGVTHDRVVGISLDLQADSGVPVGECGRPAEIERVGNLDVVVQEDDPFPPRGAGDQEPEIAFQAEVAAMAEPGVFQLSAGLELWQQPWWKNVHVDRQSFHVSLRCERGNLERSGVFPAAQRDQNTFESRCQTYCMKHGLRRADRRHDDCVYLRQGQGPRRGVEQSAVRTVVML